MKSSEGGSAGRCAPLALTGCLPDQAAHELAAEQRLGRVSLDERAPVEAAWRDLDEADQAAAAIPARVPLGTLAPDMVRLDAEIKQITHAIRMAAYNAETALARALDGDYARAGDEAQALIREALTTSRDIRPGNGELLIRSTCSPRPGAPRPWPRSATSSPKPNATTRAPISSCATRSNPIQALHKRSPYVGSPEHILAAVRANSDNGCGRCSGRAGTIIVAAGSPVGSAGSPRT